MSEKHIGEVVQVIGPVLDIRFAHDELPPLLNAIEIDNDGAKLVAATPESIKLVQLVKRSISCLLHHILRYSLPQRRLSFRLT